MWSGDASLQQTRVLGPGDGCGKKPEGNANEIQGDVARCYEGRPGSGGSSLGMSHLQSAKGTSCTPVLPRTDTHSALKKQPLSSQATFSPLGETIFDGQLGDVHETGGSEERATKTVEAAVQSSGLGSWITWIARDARRRLWSSPTELQEVIQEGQQSFRTRWSSHLISLVRESRVVSVVKDSQAFYLVKESHVFSRVKDSHLFSMVKKLPLVQHIQTEIAQHLWADEAARILQGYISPPTTRPPILSQSQDIVKAEENAGDLPLTQEDNWTTNMSISDLPLPGEQDQARIHLKDGDQTITEVLQVKHCRVSHAIDQELKGSVNVKDKNDVRIFRLTLLELPEAFVNLQNLPLQDLLTSLQSVLSTSALPSQGIVALFWLNVAKCSQPEPRPALLILMETCLYTLTTDSGLLLFFHHLPLLQLKEVQIGLAGHSVRLMGSTEESILGLYTHSQMLTKELCWALLNVICPGDVRVSQHPLLHGDWRNGGDRMSLDWQAHVPDLLLDAGLRVCCQFQKSLADLVYILHCNMEQETVSLGEVQLLLYTSVKVYSSSDCTETLTQLLLTDTHLGLVQEDIVFHPTPRSVTVQPCHPQFHNLTLRQRSDVRCVLVHDEDQRGATRLDVILANVRSRGHPESVTKAASPPAHTSNSSPHSEVWKLTFSCSAEAACLINHLSNV